MQIELIESRADIDAARIEGNARPMLNALMLIRDSGSIQAAHDIAEAAIEYATGAHDPECYADTALYDGANVDAAGTFQG